MRHTKEQVKNDKKINITIGYELIKRIIDRLENPTIEKIGTLYNVLGKEKISSYGRILKYYYDRQSWLGDEGKINERKLWKIAVEQGLYDEYMIVNIFEVFIPALGSASIATKVAKDSIQIVFKTLKAIY